jgi:hypothetical protein
MGGGGVRLKQIVLLGAALALWGADPGSAQTLAARIDEALQNITTLVRAGRVGYATFWDGNKYIQCRRWPSRELRCEAAGTTMQPSLKSVLAPDRLKRLETLGWALDPNFGNYAQTFIPDMATRRVADRILQTLTDVYNVQVANLEIQTAWVIDIPCPPRSGPSQNLAGSVTGAVSMRATAVYTCSYTPPATTPQIVASSAELVALYGSTVTSEIQRLRINRARKVFVIFGAGIGYIQCAPETSPPSIYCEAQSAESWPALAAILTPERVARLRKAGYAEPGRGPNYSKNYPLDKFSDTAIASELLTILYDAYGYTGATTLKITPES